MASVQRVIHRIEIRSTATPDELADLFECSRSLVNLSRHESFSLIMTETMAVGTPVLATATDGTLEQIFLLSSLSMAELNSLGSHVSHAAC